MTAQIIEIAGQKMAMLPVADYERLLEIAEDRADVQAAVRADERRQAGEDYVPAELLDRIMAGENPLRAWRQYRGLTQVELGTRAGVSNLTVSRIEKGERETSVKNWRALADALSVDVDDIMPLD
ncbi:helix-turn-helix transcriptional regulator [Sphingopyxis sp.]|uniref:helix-turn-helix transcriptional regulator n=1 Tax=Sphingopyxis sp. TaxID=1908224 RepID=UPI00262EABDD|nr:helix-turn-helix transcriptional regulator [Sphingopyxis sp.]MCW0197034.1 helix-turn-helix transcriptional regulator [Sphingopyxis sp.]